MAVLLSWCCGGSSPRARRSKKRKVRSAGVTASTAAAEKKEAGEVVEDETEEIQLLPEGKRERLLELTDNSEWKPFRVRNRWDNLSFPSIYDFKPGFVIPISRSRRGEYSRQSSFYEPASSWDDDPAAASSAGAEDEAMREPQQQQQQQQQQQLPLNHLSAQQLQEMAQRQQQQIEAQQQMLVAKEQRLKYLRQQDFRQQQMAAEYERLRRLREKVEAQELKLRKLRALRGQQQQQPQNLNANAAVLADLESIRSVFNEKEKELAVAVRKVEELTHQLEDLRSGGGGGRNGGGGGQGPGYPPQVVELERLRRELTYRRQLNEQQNSMIAQQRAQLSMGRDEMLKIDSRILELQDRLARKRMLNQQLASQISAATSAKQAQLRAIQQGINRSSAKLANKPVSTVEPFQRLQQSAAAAAAGPAQEDLHNKINKNVAGQDPVANDPKYQTLPFGTKFGGGPGPGSAPGQMSHASKSQKIEQLKQEKENNNVQFADDLPPPPPGGGAGPYGGAAAAASGFVDHQGNFHPAPAAAGGDRPVSSVAPVFQQQQQQQRQGPGGSGSLQRPTQLFPDNFTGHNAAAGKPDEAPSTKPKPALPPKPLVSKGGQQQPPPYVPAPMPDNSRHLQQQDPSGSHDDSSITIRGNQSYQPSGNLSVSAHPEEGTSVDDDSPSDEDKAGKNNGHFNANNVHISINRRIEMPPAFHFPEDQTPPSDLVGQNQQGGDVGDGAAVSTAAAGAYPMMNQMYKEFDQLTTEEKDQLFAANRALQEEQEQLLEYQSQAVPEFESDHEDGGRPRPPGIIRTTNLKGREGAVPHDKHVCFDPLALLLDASLEGELDLVRRTAGQVADPSAANDEGITALHNAICAGHFDIVRFLVEFGCDVNAQDSDGWTPLHCAASCNNLPMVRFLVERGACVFAATFSDHETAAEKCEEDEEGFAGCSEYLYGTQERLGGGGGPDGNGNVVYAVFDYAAQRPDELSFAAGDALAVLRRGDDDERDWWWARAGSSADGKEGYIPKNFLGLHARVTRGASAAAAVAVSSSSSMSEGGSSEEGGSSPPPPPAASEKPPQREEAERASSA